MRRVPPRIVIRDALLAGEPPLGGASVVVEGRRVARVARAGERVEPQPGDWEVDAAGRLLLPGAVDAHAHLAAGALLRLLGLDGRRAASRAEARGRIEERLDGAALEALAAAAALDALRAGVTCVLDLVRAAPGREDEALPAVARGVGACGLRAALAYGASDRGGEERGLAGVRASAAFAEAAKREPSLRAMAGLDGLAHAGPATLAELAGPAARFGLQVAVGEDEADLARAYAATFLRPVQFLGAGGLLGPRTVVAHGGALAAAEASLLARTESWLAVTPRADRFWTAEPPPLEMLAAHGCSLALGTDGLFPDVAGEAADLALEVRRPRHGSPPAELLGRVLWPGGGALASQLFGERLGVVEAGALADLVVLDWRPPLPLPDGQPGDLVLLWSGARAAWSIVDGVVRLREGQLLGGDEVEIAARAREAAARVLAA